MKKRKRTVSKAHACWHKKISRPSWKVTRVLVHGQKMKTRKTRGGASLLILSMKVTLALLWNQNLRGVYPRIQLANLQFCHILWNLKYKWVKWISNGRFLRGPPPPPCFRIGGAEDNFIFYIEYCFFFVPVMKLRWEYNISKQFQSISCLTVWLRAHFPPSKMLIWGKISIFDTKNLISRYFTTFQLPNHLHLQEMSKI